MNSKSSSVPMKVTTSFFHQEFEGNFRMKHSTESVTYKNRLHTHNFYELLLCFSDSCHVLINDTIYRVNQKDLILLNNFDVHGVILSENVPFERYVIEFDPTYMQDMCKYYNVLTPFEDEQHPTILSLDEEQLDVYMSLFQKLYSVEKSGERAELPLLRKMAFTELLLTVNGYANNQNKAPLYLEDIQMQRIQTAVSYIKGHLEESISADELAKMVFLSPSYFRSMFHSKMGCSVNQYIQNQRIIRATNLLKESLSVQEVAEKSGFNDYAHFICTFKKYTGLPPGQYRKKYYGNSPNVSKDEFFCAIEN